LEFPSDSVFSWPVATPAEADLRAVLSAEVEVVGLFDELRDRLLRYLLALGLPAHDGEEIVQESFLLLFQHLLHGKSRENLRGWIFCVARNLALRLREKNRTSLRQSVDFDENVIESAAANDLNPEELVWHRQRRTRLLAVVRAMPERDQSCVLLRAEGLRYREIASILGISLGSVAASVARALQRLDRADRSSDHGR
jgi:RNA polymerase sigma-70 factor, ECF subfamily